MNIFALGFIIAIAAVVGAEAVEISGACCRTRFTFARPTNGNLSSMLLGTSQQQQNCGGSTSLLSFNHGNTIDFYPATKQCASMSANIHSFLCFIHSIRCCTKMKWA